MHNVVIRSFLYLLLKIVVIDGKFYNETMTDFSGCKVIYSREDRTYNTFFELREPIENKLAVDFHFHVLAVSDAHIMLTPSKQIKITDPVYEIVIGAGGNAFSDIRRKQKGDVRASNRRKGLLSAVDARGFWIHVYKNGTINVGQDGQFQPFISWTDLDRLPVKYFSFSSWDTIDAKWYVNCPRNEDSSKGTQFLTEMDKLKMDILNTNESHNQNVNIFIQLTTNFINLDEKQSVLNVRGTAILTWTFLPIHWKPEKYNGIKSLILHHDEIWKPELIVTNAIDNTNLQPFKNSPLVADSMGNVKWQAAYDMFTYCDMNGIENWPNDIHTCKIEIYTWHSENDFVRFRFLGALNNFQFNSEWKIEEIVAQTHEYPISTGTANDYLKLPTALEIRFKIRRQSTLYTLIFHSPLYVLSMLMLINCWCSPFDNSKLSIISAQFVLTTMIFMGVSMILPMHQVKIPKLVHRYNIFMIANIINLIMTILVLNISRRKQQYEPPHAITRIVKSNLLEKILLLPDLAPKMVSAYPVAMESIRRKSFVQDIWIRLAICIDRITFIVYFLFVICALWLF